jgi:heterodisulfide reductase subunit A-like polyferredoxin
LPLTLTGLSSFPLILWQLVIVVGSGLAGLTAAIALAKAGHRVQVLESAPEITYIGAGERFIFPVSVE